jgi:hypothetical protein
MQRVDNIIADLAARGGPIPIQVFLAPSPDNNRKPGTGMWEFFVQNCNAGVAPGVCSAGKKGREGMGGVWSSAFGYCFPCCRPWVWFARRHPPASSHRVLACTRMHTRWGAADMGESFFVGDAAGRSTDIGEGASSDK